MTTAPDIALFLSLGEGGVASRAIDRAKGSVYYRTSSDGLCATQSGNYTHVLFVCAVRGFFGRAETKAAPLAQGGSEWCKQARSTDSLIARP